MPSDIAIKVENLTKIYRLYDSPTDRLKEALNPFRKKFHRDFYALTDVNLEVRKGDTVGIIGQNGAGKSTLLKMITGVITPTSGRVQVNGRISALLELGAGFNPDISGLENVYFNGTLLGFSRKEMDAKIDDILSFADIGDFIHQRVRIYSSGMFIRLAFAVAVHVDPEILIVDEALSVGDSIFQGKCMDKIKSMMSNGVTTLFVTHSMDNVNTLCNHAYMLDGGKVFTQGKAQVVTLQYYQLLREREHAAQALKNAGTVAEKDAIKADFDRLKKEIQDKTEQEDYRYGTGGARVRNFTLLNADDVETNVFRCGEHFKLRILVEFLTRVEHPCFGCVISNISGQNLLTVHTFHDGDVKFEPRNPGDELEIEMETTVALNPGKYLLSIGVSDSRTMNDFTNLDARKNICRVEVYGKEYYHGLIHHEPVVRIVSAGQPCLVLDEMQQMFCAWNAERLGIDAEESRRRYEKSWNAVKGGHRGKEYRDFGVVSHEISSVFWNDSKKEAFEAYKMHEYTHLLRMVTYPTPAWRDTDPVAGELLKLDTISIVDFGCGMAQKSIALAEFLLARNKQVKLNLADIPTIIKDFLMWVTAKRGVTASFLDCTLLQPLPDIPPCNLIIATEVFEHLHDPLPAFRRLDSALLPGGFIITDVSDHAEEFMHVSPDLSQLRDELSARGYLEIEQNRIYRKHAVS